MLGTHAEERSEGISRSSGGHECPCHRERVHSYQRRREGVDLRGCKDPDPASLEMVVHKSGGTFLKLFISPALRRLMANRHEVSNPPPMFPPLSVPPYEQRCQD